MPLPELLYRLLEDPTTPNYVFRDAIRDTLGEDAVVEVYLVCGCMGLSKSPSWVAAGFLDRQDAEDLKDKLNQWLLENKLHVSNCGPYPNSPSGSIACGAVVPTILVCGYVPSGFSPIQVAALGCGSVIPSTVYRYTKYEATSYRPFIECPYDPEYDDSTNGTRYEIMTAPLKS